MILATGLAEMRRPQSRYRPMTRARRERPGRRAAEQRDEHAGAAAVMSSHRSLLAALSAPRYGLKKEAVITPQIAVVLPLTLVLLIATLVLVSLAMRE